MQVTRFEQAPWYEAPKHFDMRCLRLQGFDASDANFAWIGFSHFLPGARADMDVSPLEKIYVALEGEITIELGDGTVDVLRKFDSCLIPGGEARAVRNNTNSVAAMLVVMPYPEASS